MIKKVDFTRTNDCPRVLSFVAGALEADLPPDLEPLAVDAVNTLKLNNPVSVNQMDVLRLGYALASMKKE